MLLGTIIEGQRQECHVLAGCGILVQAPLACKKYLGDHISHSLMRPLHTMLPLCKMSQHSWHCKVLLSFFPKPVSQIRVA